MVHLTGPALPGPAHFPTPRFAIADSLIELSEPTTTQHYTHPGITIIGLRHTPARSRSSF